MDLKDFLVDMMFPREAMKSLSMQERREHSRQRPSLSKVRRHGNECGVECDLGNGQSSSVAAKGRGSCGWKHSGSVPSSWHGQPWLSALAW